MSKKRKILLTVLGIIIFILVSHLKLPNEEGYLVVHIKAVADQEYRQFTYNWEDSWKDRIRKVIQSASEEFEEQFKIKFVIDEISEWDRKNPGEYVSYWDFGREVKKGKSNIVIGFVKQEIKIFNERVTGLAAPGNHILISKQWSIAKEGRWVIHEIGHHFGGGIFFFDFPPQVKIGSWTLYKAKRRLMLDCSNTKFDWFNTILINTLKYFLIEY